ncbi:MAG: hypothetical protein CMF48_01705 [Legionellales bacterium]|nr:hypothetical protein [Legionellales bacterium]
MTDLMRLRALSCMVGQNPLWVQAAGGNTSVKEGNTLWIKASGACLSDAYHPSAFVPVNREASLAQSTLVYPDSGTRPSMETWMHLALPQQWVIHTHPVNVLAWACREDAEAQINKKLADLNATFLPYHMPGKPLASALAAAQRKATTQAFILANHGLIVAADSETEAMAMHQQIEDALMVVPTVLGQANEAALEKKLKNTPGYRLPNHPLIHQLALSPQATQWVQTRAPYPDHVVFCHQLVHLYPVNSDKKVLLYPHEGVLIPQTSHHCVEAMLLMFAEWFLRLDLSCPIRWLTSEEKKALLNLDAERYRQQQVQN